MPPGPDDRSTLPGPGGARTPDRTRGPSLVPLLAAVVLMAAPSLLFLATWLSSPVLSAGCVALGGWSVLNLARSVRGPSAPVDAGLLALALAAGLGLCLLGGEAHLVFANDDWLVRDAVLSDLVARSWPVGYLYEGDRTVLRAPLGLYLVPAAVGKGLGLGAAHVALLLQNGCILAGLIYGLSSTSRSRARCVWIGAVFLVFSGWDIVGQLVTHAFSAASRPLAIGTHLEHWLADLQFSAHVTQIFWVPHHAVSGWAFVAAYRAWQTERLPLSSLVVVFGVCVFWSPLSMIGALPLLGWAASFDLRRGSIRPSDVAVTGVAALALAPVALYLVLDTGRIPQGRQPYDLVFAVKYGLLLLLEVVPFLLLLLLFRRQPPTGRARADLPIAVAILLVVPLFRFGGADFVMRASIPALAILALALAERAWPIDGRPAALPLAATLCVLGIGAATPLYEVARALTTPAFAIGDCNFLNAARDLADGVPLFHYLARTGETGWLGPLVKTPDVYLALEPRPYCWPDRIAPP